MISNSDAPQDENLPFSDHEQNMTSKDDVRKKRNEVDVFERFELNCPFTWKPDTHVKFHLDDILDECMDADELFDQSSFRIRRFVIHLLYCYVNFYKRMVKKSLENLQRLEQMLITQQQVRDSCLTTIYDALFHIVQSCKIYLLYETNRKEEAFKLVETIKHNKEMDEVNQAGIWGIRSCVYAELGHDGLQAAILYAEKAVTIDRTNSYWYFLEGVYKGRLRRMESGLQIPSPAEIEALEIAMKLKSDSSFFAFTAEVYSETSNKSLKMYLKEYKNKQDSSSYLSIIEKHNMRLNLRARDLFKQCIDLNPNCSHLLFRCGKGLIKLPPPFQDLKGGLQNLKRGLAISPNNCYGNHVMAKYYEKIERNNELAKKYLKICIERKNYGAEIDLLRIEFFEKRDADALLTGLIKLFDRYQDRIKHCKILAELISFHLFIDYNLSEAVNYMRKLLYIIDDSHFIIKNHRSGIVRFKNPVSLLDVLLSDIYHRSIENNLFEEENVLCECFLRKLCFDNIELPQHHGENLRKKIVADIKNSQMNIDLEKIKPSVGRNTSKDYDVSQGKKEPFIREFYDKQTDPSQTSNVVDLIKNLDIKTHENLNASKKDQNANSSNNEGECSSDNLKFKYESRDRRVEVKMNGMFKLAEKWVNSQLKNENKDKDNTDEKKQSRQHPVSNRSERYKLLEDLYVDKNYCDDDHKEENPKNENRDHKDDDCRKEIEKKHDCEDDSRERSRRTYEYYDRDDERKLYKKKYYDDDSVDDKHSVHKKERRQKKYYSSDTERFDYQKERYQKYYHDDSDDSIRERSRKKYHRRKKYYDDDSDDVRSERSRKKYEDNDSSDRRTERHRKKYYDDDNDDDRRQRVKKYEDRYSPDHRTEKYRKKYYDDESDDDPRRRFKEKCDDYYSRDDRKEKSRKKYYDDESDNNRQQKSGKKNEDYDSDYRRERYKKKYQKDFDEDYRYYCSSHSSKCAHEDDDNRNYERKASKDEDQYLSSDKQKKEGNSMNLRNNEELNVDKLSSTKLEDENNHENKSLKKTEEVNEIDHDRQLY